MASDERGGLQMKYFVLKPGGNDAYAKASREAMMAYSFAIRAENPELSRQLREWSIAAELARREGE